MINNNYELNNDIVTKNTKISKTQIIDYVINNKILKNNIYKILLKYYIEYINFDEIYKEVLERFKEDWRGYYQEDIKITEQHIIRMIKNSISDTDVNLENNSLYIEDVFGGKEFENYLHKQLLKI
jgi:hypothetical protein